MIEAGLAELESLQTDAFNRHFRDYLLSEYAADMTKSTRMTQSEHQACLVSEADCVPFLTRHPVAKC